MAIEAMAKAPKKKNALIPIVRLYRFLFFSPIR